MNPHSFPPSYSEQRTDRALNRGDHEALATPGAWETLLGRRRWRGQAGSQRGCKPGLGFSQSHVHSALLCPAALGQENRPASCHTQSAALSDPASPRDKITGVFKTPVQRPEEPLSGSEKAGFQSWGPEVPCQLCKAGASCFLGLLYGPGTCLLPAGYSRPVPRTLDTETGQSSHSSVNTPCP